LAHSIPPKVLSEGSFFLIFPLSLWSLLSYGIWDHFGIGGFFGPSLSRLVSQGLRLANFRLFYPWCLKLGSYLASQVGNSGFSFSDLAIPGILFALRFKVWGSGTFWNFAPLWGKNPSLD